MDEMKIKKHLNLCGGKEYEYIDLGKGADSESLLSAALVLLIVCENGGCKIPVSFYLINSLNAEDKADIVIKNLTAVHEANIVVTSLTFDGLSSNLAMCKELGADLDVDNLKNCFLDSVTKKKVFIILDACHDLKLIRNSLATESSNFFDEDGNLISLKYFEKLVDLQELNKLHQATNFTQNRIQYEQNIINVRLAAQTFSLKNADALTFCKYNLNLPEFEKVDGTAKLCSTVNSAFDILNSRQLRNKDPSKNRLDEKNIEKVRIEVKKIANYLKTLKNSNN